MITLCWAAKGGSGTTVVAAALALAAPDPTLLVDLAGDLPAALGLPDPDGPGVGDWLRSEASPSRLAALEIPVDGRVSVLHAGDGGAAPGERWAGLARHLRDERRTVVVDAGTGAPPPALLEVADHAWLVTRACYLSLRAAVRQRCRPTGVVLVEEPGRALRRGDIEVTVGAPVVTTLLVDPAVARAVDAGLLVSRLPAGFRRVLRDAA
jgi:hypothetical protein